MDPEFYGRWMDSFIVFEDLALALRMKWLKLAAMESGVI